jgi:hypothetical protein
MAKHRVPPRGIFPIADEYRKGAPSAWFVATGEFRPPNKREYYLSGAIVAAYLSPCTLDTSMWIAKPVDMATCPRCGGMGKVPVGVVDCTPQ